jgi:hypothetical protein
MKVLTTVHGSYVTGSEIADAVIRCHDAVSATREIDCISVPFVADGGGLRWVTILVGPPYGIGAETIDSSKPELVDPAVIARVEDRIRDVHPYTSTPFTSDDMQWAEGMHGRQR